jgi:hypothetical protein
VPEAAYASPRSIPVENPATGEVIGTVPVLGAEELAEMASRAREAQRRGSGRDQLTAFHGANAFSGLIAPASPGWWRLTTSPNRLSSIQSSPSGVYTSGV